MKMTFMYHAWEEFGKRKSSLPMKMPKVLSLCLALLLSLSLIISPVLAVDTTDTVCLLYGEFESQVILKNNVRGYLWHIENPQLFHIEFQSMQYKGWCYNHQENIHVPTLPEPSNCYTAHVYDAPRLFPWCQVGYIMTKYTTDTSPASAGEAAAIQVAIWKYIEGGRKNVEVYPDPDTNIIETDALAIYDEAAIHSVIGPNSTMSFAPQGSTTVADSTASHTFCAHIDDIGCLAGIEVEFSTDDGSFVPPTDPDHPVILTTINTNGSGDACVTLYWNASLSSFEANLTAKTIGNWPILIEPPDDTQDTIISKNYKLDDEYDFKYEPCQCSLEIKKKDTATGDYMELGAAEFHVAGPGDYDEYVTDGDGNDQDPTDKTVIVLSDLTCGEYTVTETKPPAGYDKPESPDDTDKRTSTCDESVIKFEFENTPCLGKIIIEKWEETSCGDCDGKVTALTLQYNGSSSAMIKVADNDDRVLFKDTVGVGEQFSFIGKDKKGTMTKEIVITQDDGKEITIHTSCSQPIGVGFVFGDFLVIAGESQNGGAFCPAPNKIISILPGAKFEIYPNPYGSGTLTVEDNVSPDTDSTPGIILLEDVPCNEYTITEIEAPLGYGLDPTPQTKEVHAGGEVVFDLINRVCGECKGGVTSLTLQYNGTASARIEVHTSKGIVFNDMVDPGQLFSFQGSDNKDGKLGKEIQIKVYFNDTLATTTKIHTSCSRTIGIGSVFDDFVVVAGASFEGGLLCPHLRGQP